MKNKVFVTGIFGSGKTTFAEKYAEENDLEYIGFDKVFDYYKKGNQAPKILKTLPDSFVIDAIPFYGEANWDDFVKYEKSHRGVLVVCVYCPVMATWLKRVGKRAVYYRDLKGSLKYRAKKILRKETVPENVEKLYAEFRDFFVRALPYLKNFKNVKYYDTCANEYTDLREMQKRMSKDEKSSFQEYLKRLSGGYDRYYQDIEAINLKGYSESYKTWKAIKKLVNWKNKKVVDLGCFHGYFSFKAEDVGAKVTGLDRHETVVTTSRWINELRSGVVEFRQWEGGQPIPKCDIVLCLNVLHHFPDPDKVIRMMKCKKMIFEINKNDRPKIERRLRILKTIRSRRAHRTILLCEPQKSD